MSDKEAPKTELEKQLEAELQLDEEAAPEQEDAEPNEEVPVEDAENAEEVPKDPIAELTAERDELQDRLLRARAEFDNYRKRVARDNQRIRKMAAEKLMGSLLPVLDNLERALSHADDASRSFADGVELVANQFQEALKTQGLETIPALGEAFDPNVHEALSSMPSEEHPADVVAQEYERGYRLGDYVLRPAKVVVSSGPAEPQEAPAQEDGASEEPIDDMVSVDADSKED